jgi:hypothetical protein
LSHFLTSCFSASAIIFSGHPSRFRGWPKKYRFWLRGRRAAHGAGQSSFDWPSGARAGRAPYWLWGAGGKLMRRQVTEARVRTLAMVRNSPPLDLAPRVVERDEYLLVEALLAQAAVE